MSVRAGHRERKTERWPLGACGTKERKGRDIERKKQRNGKLALAHVRVCVCVCYVSLCEYLHMYMQIHGLIYVWKPELDNNYLPYSLSPTRGFH